MSKLEPIIAVHCASGQTTYGPAEYNVTEGTITYKDAVYTSPTEFLKMIKVKKNWKVRVILISVRGATE